MTLDYFYGQAGELFSFFRIPKALFQEQRFQDLSTDAKTLYGILLDRMSLSVKNGWLDEQNRVFIIFTIEDVKRALCCADNKATKLLRELEKFGLIERKRRGQGKPSLVYVKNFSAESSKESVKNRDNDDSYGFKIACQDPAKSRCNKTDENNTEKSETVARQFFCETRTEFLRKNSPVLRSKSETRSLASTAPKMEGAAHVKGRVLAWGGAAFAAPPLAFCPWGSSYPSAASPASSAASWAATGSVYSDQP